ncbi:unnamed protein product [Allacma fusca]|uniref:Uncharacterized protein n=1 Tax=Allacma fusca TaxID=39272 RepID=A0A8J2L1Y8_9HEXA|nr:unnamed protein product [Allacma fusca]
MCRTHAMEFTVQSNITEAGTGTVPVLNSRQHSKSTFRLSPFRKVAKSARINLNRYWGLLSQSSLAKPLPLPAVQSTEQDFSIEEEQNRMNEMLEAQAASAMSDNERNSQYENSPEFQRHYYHLQRLNNSLNSSWASLDLSQSAITSDSISQRSMIL